MQHFRNLITNKKSRLVLIVSILGLILIGFFVHAQQFSASKCDKTQLHAQQQLKKLRYRQAYDSLKPLVAKCTDPELLSKKSKLGDNSKLLALRYQITLAQAAYGSGKTEEAQDYATKVLDSYNKKLNTEQKKELSTGPYSIAGVLDIIDGTVPKDIRPKQK